MKLRGFLLIPPTPSRNLQSIFFIVLLLTLLEKTDSSSPWKSCDPPPLSAKKSKISSNPPGYENDFSFNIVVYPEFWGRNK